MSRLNWSMTKHPLNHYWLVFKVFFLPDVCFLICFLCTQKSNPSGWFQVGVVCKCVCVRGHRQASIPGNRNSIRRGKKRSLILTDCHRKIPVKKTFFFPFFVYIFKKSFCLTYESMPLNQFPNIWRALARCYGLPPPFPPPPVEASCSGSVLHRDVTRRAAPLLTSQKWMVCLVTFPCRF